MSSHQLCCVNLSKYSVLCTEPTTARTICNEINEQCGILCADYFLVSNGMKVNDCDMVSGLVRIVPRLVGGKGGFGSMLRAIGAQIEKTTNREACRDLSGRRLRDINEEQRLKNWIAQQAEREQEAAERKRLKLEKLCREPKHDFKDELYEKERSELSEKVSSSVEEGLKSSAGASTSSSKRTHSETKNIVKKKKKKMLIDIDDEFSSSDSEVEQSISTASACTVTKAKNDEVTSQL